MAVTKRALRCELTYFGKRYASTNPTEAGATYGRVSYIWYMMGGDYIDLEVYNTSIATRYSNRGTTPQDAGLDYTFRHNCSAQTIPPTSLTWRIGCRQWGDYPTAYPELVISKPKDNGVVTIYKPGNVAYQDENFSYISQVVPETVSDRLEYLRKRCHDVTGNGGGVTGGTPDNYGWSDAALKNPQDVPTHNYITYTNPDPHIRRRPPLWMVTGNPWPSLSNRQSFDIAPGLGNSFPNMSPSNIRNYAQRFRFASSSDWPDHNYENNQSIYLQNEYMHSFACEYIMDLIRHANDHDTLINGHMHSYLGGVGPTVSDGIRTGGVNGTNYPVTVGNNPVNAITCWQYRNSGSPQYRTDNDFWYNDVLSIEQAMGSCYNDWGNDVPGWVRPTKGTNPSSYTQFAYLGSGSNTKYIDYTFFTPRFTPTYDCWALDTCIFRIYKSNLNRALSYMNYQNTANYREPNLNTMPYVGILPLRYTNLAIADAANHTTPYWPSDVMYWHSAHDIIGDCIKLRFGGCTGVGSDTEKILWSNNCGSRANSPYIGSTIFGVNNGLLGIGYYAEPNYLEGSVDVYGTVGIRVQSVYLSDNDTWDSSPGSISDWPAINCFIVPSFYSSWPALDIYGYSRKTPLNYNTTAAIKWRQEKRTPGSGVPDGAIDAVVITATDSVAY